MALTVQNAPRGVITAGSVSAELSAVLIQPSYVPLWRVKLKFEVEARLLPDWDTLCNRLKQR